MSATQEAANPLVLNSRSPDTSIIVQVHPLVLLTITDYITRHTLRSQKGPVVGAVIGQQNGRNYTLEHAFQCQVEEQDGQVLMDEAWFVERLEQYKEVHKAPQLDLAAIFTLGPTEGPQPAHLPVLQQVQKLTSIDGLMLLLFHPELVDSVQGGKLPMTIYESIREQEDDSSKFRELVFDVDSGDAEMIGVDFVAKGGGNATVVPKSSPTADSSANTESSSSKKKAKGKEKDREANEELPSTAYLSPENEELISSLTAKVNAIKMLNQRINLIKLYLESQPTSYLLDATSTEAPPETTNHSLLRQIQAILSRLPLLMSPTLAQFSDRSADQTHLDLTAGEKEKQDVHLTALLAALTRSVHEAQGLASKFSVFHKDRANKERQPFGRGNFGGGGRMGMDDGYMGETAGGY